MDQFLEFVTCGGGVRITDFLETKGYTPGTRVAPGYGDERWPLKAENQLS